MARHRAGGSLPGTTRLTASGSPRPRAAFAPGAQRVRGPGAPARVHERRLLPELSAFVDLERPPASMSGVCARSSARSWTSSGSARPRAAFAPRSNVRQDRRPDGTGIYLPATVERPSSDWA